MVYKFNNENTIDVDKIRGFVNTSGGSILFWILVFYFTVIGFKHVVSISKESIDINLIMNLLTHHHLLLFSDYSSINQIVNFSLIISQLNKTGMGSFESITTRERFSAER